MLRSIVPPAVVAQLVNGTWGGLPPFAEKYSRVLRWHLLSTELPQHKPNDERGKANCNNEVSGTAIKRQRGSGHEEAETGSRHKYQTQQRPHRRTDWL